MRATAKILLFLLATMAFPAEVAMIPSFLLLKDLHLLNTFAALVLPTAASEGVVIRGLQAELRTGGQLKWQVLVMQPSARAAEFSGRIEITLDGLQNGKAWTLAPPGGAQALQLRQYRRLEGVIDLPPQTVVKTVTAKVFEGSSVRAVQTFKL